MRRGRRKGSPTPSTSARSDPLIEGKLYDGGTAHPHAVRVTVSGGCLGLSHDGGWSDSIDAAQLKRIEAGPSLLRLGRSDLPGWRLLLPADAEPALAAVLGKRERYGRWIDRIGLIPALVAGGILTASVIAIGYIAPQWIAPHVPMSWERNVGGAVRGGFRDPRGRRAKGPQAPGG